MTLLQPLEDENRRLKRLAILAAVISVFAAFVLMACQGPRSVQAFPASHRYAAPFEQHAPIVVGEPMRWANFADKR
jgi:hypothetical protein